MFLEGRPKIDHLAQLVFYLIFLQETRGKLVYRFFPKKGVVRERKEFRIEIGNDGEILVDGTKHQFSVANQLEHQLLAAEAIKELGVIERPNSEACKWCKTKVMCKAYEGMGGTIKQFLEVGTW